MLIVGYCFGIRSERRLCEEVHLNLAYRWFCRLGAGWRGSGPLDFLEEPPWSLPRQRSAAATVRDRVAPLHGRGAGRRRRLRRRCQSDPGRRQTATASRAPRVCRRSAVSRAVDEYLAVLDDAAFGAASEVTPKFICAGRSGCAVDRGARRTGVLRLFDQLPDRRSTMRSSSMSRRRPRSVRPKSSRQSA